MSGQYQKLIAGLIEIAPLLLLVLLAGGFGGLINALLTDGGFKSGYRENLSNGQTIYRPGLAGNVIIGGVGALVVWVFYGVSNISDGTTVQELLRQLVAAILAGVGGGRVITNEVDKRILNATNDQLAEALKNMVKK